jgi:hypothetical protein
MVFEAKARSDSGGSDARENPIARTERILIERIRNGEKELFADLIRPYERQVYVTAVAILQNEADAQEVAQEAISKPSRISGSFVEIRASAPGSRASRSMKRACAGEKSIAKS